MMPLDRMPSISLGIIVHVGTSYDASFHWRTDAGELRASVGFDAGGHSNAHLQGPPAALRELAAALLEAADRAESAEEPATVVAGAEGGAGWWGAAAPPARPAPPAGMPVAAGRSWLMTATGSWSSAAVTACSSAAVADPCGPANAHDPPASGHP